MKSPIYFIVILLAISLFLMNCQGQDNNKKIFQGNWQYCDTDGYYVELHVNGDYLEWCIDISPLGTPYEFEISNDSLCAFNPNDRDQNEKAKIVIFSNDSLLLVYQDSNNQGNDTIFLTRLYDEIDFVYDRLYDTKGDPEKYAEFEENYLRKFNERSQNKCEREDTNSLGEIDIDKIFDSQ